MQCFRSILLLYGLWSCWTENTCYKSAPVYVKTFPNAAVIHNALFTAELNQCIYEKGDKPPAGIHQMFIYKQKNTLNVLLASRRRHWIFQQHGEQHLVFCKTCKVILSLIHRPKALRRRLGMPLCIFHHFLLPVFNYSGYFQPRRPLIEVYSLPPL